VKPCDMRHIISLVESTGLFVASYTDDVILAYSARHKRHTIGERYIDVAGLLASDDRKRYALGCYQMAGAR